MAGPLHEEQRRAAGRGPQRSGANTCGRSGGWGRRERGGGWGGEEGGVLFQRERYPPGPPPPAAAAIGAAGGRAAPAAVGGGRGGQAAGGAARGAGATTAAALQRAAFPQGTKGRSVPHPEKVSKIGVFLQRVTRVRCMKSTINLLKKCKASSN